MMRGCDTKFLSGRAPDFGRRRRPAASAGASGRNMRCTGFLLASSQPAKASSHANTATAPRRGLIIGFRGIPMVSRALQIGQCRIPPTQQLAQCSTHPARTTGHAVLARCKSVDRSRQIPIATLRNSEDSGGNAWRDRRPQFAHRLVLAARILPFTCPISLPPNFGYLCRIQEGDEISVPVAGVSFI